MIKNIIVWLHYKGTPVWLFYILAFEFFVATNLSPTILTDTPSAWFVIPKSIAIYSWVKNSPINWAQELIITPLTTSKPPRMSFSQRFSAEKIEVDELPKEKRSRASAIFWSLMTLLFMAMAIFVWVFNTGFTNTSEYVQSMHNRVAIGGAAMWFQLSFKQMTFAALLISISIVIIKDYLVFFRLIINRG